VAVDESGRHHPALGIDLPSAPFGDPPDVADAVADDPHVGAERAEAGPVDHGSVADHDVIGHGATFAELPLMSID
jgi:hypothetical protein